jgi:predicted transcriptional regulator
MLTGGEKMADGPERWTGRLVGKMHNERVTHEMLAQELGVTKPYISMLLNGARKPDGAKERLEAAFNNIIAKRKESNELDKRAEG